MGPAGCCTGPVEETCCTVLFGRGGRPGVTTASRESRMSLLFHDPAGRSIGCKADTVRNAKVFEKIHSLAGYRC